MEEKIIGVPDTEVVKIKWIIPECPCLDGLKKSLWKPNPWKCEIYVNEYKLQGNYGYIMDPYFGIHDLDTYEMVTWEYIQKKLENEKT